MNEKVYTENEMIAVLEASAAVCKIYFEIAEEAIGEDELRKRFQKRLAVAVKKQKRKRKK